MEGNETPFEGPFFQSESIMSLISDIELVNVIGSPAQANGITFVPALFDFSSGLEGKVEFGLTQLPFPLEQSKTLHTSREVLNEEILPYWIRARVPRVFHFRPANGIETAGEHPDMGFVAVLRDEKGSPDRYIPFILIDGPHGPGLSFRQTDRDSLLKERIALAFWSLLLADPHDAIEYEDVISDEYGGTRVIYQDHQVFFCGLTDSDSSEEDYNPHFVPQYDPHSVPLPVAGFRCPDCDGEGVEDLFPYTEDCPTCGGTGSVTW